MLSFLWISKKAQVVMFGCIFLYYFVICMFADWFKNCGVILNIHNFVEILHIIAVVPLSQNWDILGDRLDFELQLLGCNFGISQIFCQLLNDFQS